MHSYHDMNPAPARYARHKGRASELISSQMVGSEEFAHRSSLLYRKIQLRRCTDSSHSAALQTHGAECAGKCCRYTHACPEGIRVCLPACPDRRCNIAGAAFTYGSQPVENCMPDNDSHPLYDHPYRALQCGVMSFIVLPEVRSTYHGMIYGNHRQTIVQ